MIGAGLIGTESAATLAAAGHEVTVLDVLERPLDRLHDPLPALGAAALAATGARFLGGVSITERRGRRRAQATVCYKGGSLRQMSCWRPRVGGRCPAWARRGGRELPLSVDAPRSGCPATSAFMPSAT